MPAASAGGNSIFASNPAGNSPADKGKASNIFASAPKDDDKKADDDKAKGAAGNIFASAGASAAPPASGGSIFASAATSSASAAPAGNIFGAPSAAKDEKKDDAAA